MAAVEGISGTSVEESRQIDWHAESLTRCSCFYQPGQLKPARRIPTAVGPSIPAMVPSLSRRKHYSTRPARPLVPPVALSIARCAHHSSPARSTERNVGLEAGGRLHHYLPTETRRAGRVIGLQEDQSLHRAKEEWAQARTGMPSSAKEHGTLGTD